MGLKELFLDLTYLIILIFLIAYGILLVVRGYLGLGLSGIKARS